MSEITAPPRPVVPSSLEVDAMPTGSYDGPDAPRRRRRRRRQRQDVERSVPRRGRHGRQPRDERDGREARDPSYERAYLARPDGDYEIGESFLTVSLGEPHNDACYKLIAAIIEDREGREP